MEVLYNYPWMDWVNGEGGAADARGHEGKGVGEALASSRCRAPIGTPCFSVEYRRLCEVRSLNPTGET
jgi:hypothetical protein